jgi:hypothetical protein
VLVRISELLDTNLAFLDPESQYTASNVSFYWRDVLVDFLKTTVQYHSHFPCAPIEYGDLVTADVPWLRPTQDETKSMETDIATTLYAPLETEFYHPARLT